MEPGTTHLVALTLQDFWKFVQRIQGAFVQLFLAFRALLLAPRKSQRPEGLQSDEIALCGVTSLSRFGSRAHEMADGNRDNR